MTPKRLILVNKTRNFMPHSTPIPKLSAQLKIIRQKLKSIPGEPCGGVKCGSTHDCQNPRHTEYFNLTQELNRLQTSLVHAKSKIPKD